MPPAASLAVPPLPLPLPERLPGGGDFAARPHATNAASERHRLPVAVTLAVRGVPAGWRTATAGLAVHGADGGGDHAWLPFGDAVEIDGALRLAHTLPAGGAATVSVAAAPEFAAHGYLARQRLAVPPDGGTLDVDANASRVALHLPAATRHAVLLRLVRSDDPHWLPLAFAPSGLQLSPGGALVLWLGAGGYELRDPLEPDRHQPFTVPTDAVAVSAELVPVRADRP